MVQSSRGPDPRRQADRPGTQREDWGLELLGRGDRGPETTQGCIRKALQGIGMERSWFIRMRHGIGHLPWSSTPSRLQTRTCHVPKCAPRGPAKSEALLYSRRYSQTGDLAKQAFGDIPGAAAVPPPRALLREPTCTHCTDRSACQPLASLFRSGHSAKGRGS